MSDKMAVTARFWREGPDWLVELVEEPRVHSYGRTLAKALDHIQHAAALWYECRPDDIAVEKILDGLDYRWIKEFHNARKDTEVAELKARVAAASAVKDLLRQGLSMRDAALILDLSHQRVHQLSGAPTTRPVEKVTTKRVASKRAS